MRKFLLFFLGCFILFNLTVCYSAPLKKWTLLIFMNGNNSLDGYTTFNLKQMEQIGSNDQINIVVQWASQSRRKAVRMLMQKSMDPQVVTSPVLEDLGLVDMGDYRNLQDFIKWGIEHYPAEHYFIEIWNHGSGWHLSKNGVGETVLNDISYDDISGHRITTEQLGQVMTETSKMIGRKIDIYGSDACQMAMAEVANEMSDSVNYYVGSQEDEPGTGWPYADLLTRWIAISDPSPRQIVTILVDAYVKFYQGSRDPVTLSSLDLSKLDDFKQALAVLSKDIRQLTPSEKKEFFYDATGQRFGQRNDYLDARDLIKHLIMFETKGFTHEELNHAEQAAEGLVIANGHSEGFFNGAYGFSIWFPKYAIDYSDFSRRYQDLKFNQKTQWNEALSYLFAK